MTTKKLREGAAVSAVDLPLEPTPQERVEAVMRRCKLVAFLGRGARGKSTGASWTVEAARRAGNPVLAIDCDRTNQSLASMIPDAIVPESGDEADVEAVLASTVERIAETREDAAVDMGGGDTVLRRTAAGQQFIDWLPTLGVDLTVLHFMGPSADDCSLLASAEEGGILAPTRTILVFNEGAVTGSVSAAAAFSATVERHPIVRATLERGARLVLMPRLPCLSLIQERRLCWADAAANRAPPGVTPLGLWRAQQTAIWLRQMDREFAAVQEWLP